MEETIRNKLIEVAINRSALQKLVEISNGQEDIPIIINAEGLHSRFKNCESTEIGEIRIPNTEFQEKIIQGERQEFVVQRTDFLRIVQKFKSSKVLRIVILENDNRVFFISFEDGRRQAYIPQTPLNEDSGSPKFFSTPLKTSPYPFMVNTEQLIEAVELAEIGGSKVKFEVNTLTPSKIIVSSTSDTKEMKAELTATKSEKLPENINSWFSHEILNRILRLFESSKELEICLKTGNPIVITATGEEGIFLQKILAPRVDTEEN